ncbi:hypothetical protein N431DRAFT_450683 [Stipitochalara longipes BDJ]|nr:hypothetical protein N431DRAFT_450683 [Stipitochalara longipes BDJ]
MEQRLLTSQTGIQTIAASAGTKANAATTLISSPTDLTTTDNGCDVVLANGSTTISKANTDDLNPTSFRPGTSHLAQPHPSEKGELSNTAEPKLTKAEKKKIKSLKERCNSLETKFAKKERELKAVQHERNIAQKETKEAKSHLEKEACEYSEALKHTKMTLEAHFNERYENLRKTKGTNEVLEKIKGELQKTQKALEKIKDKNKELRGSMHTLKEERKAQQTRTEKEINRLNARIAETMTQNNARDQQQNIKNTDTRDCPNHDFHLLKAKFEALEKDFQKANEDKEKTKPLVEIGIAVRLRFLEQARESIMGEEGGIFNQQAIREGNQAAHNANGTADAALFTTRVLEESKPSGKSWVIVFEKLYTQSPEVFLGGRTF